MGREVGQPGERRDAGGGVVGPDAAVLIGVGIGVGAAFAVLAQRLAGVVDCAVRADAPSASEATAARRRRVRALFMVILGLSDR